MASFSSEREGEAKVNSAMPLFSDGYKNHDIAHQNEDAVSEDAFLSSSVGRAEDGGKNLSSSYPGLKSDHTLQKEMSFVGDLVKVESSRYFAGEDYNQNTINEDSIFAVDKGYTSDSSIIHQTSHLNMPAYNGSALRDANLPVNGLQYEDSILTPRMYSSLSKKSKGNKKDSRSKLVNQNTNNEAQHFEGKLFSASEYDSKQSEKHKVKKRRNDSEPGNPKFIQPSSKAGVLSDDEYIINASSSHYHPGRRSAPIFSKRSFIAPDFWSGRPSAAEKMRGHERQKAKPPSTNIFSKVPGKLNDFSAYMPRPHSVDPSNLSNKAKDNQTENQQVNGGFTSQGKRYIGNYGSTDNAAKGNDRRGYHSDAETRDWKLQNLISPDRQSLPGKGDLHPNGVPSWNVANSALFRGGNFEDPLYSSETERTHGMKGTFRAPHIITPRDLQVRVVQGKDAMKVGKNTYDKILSNDDNDVKDPSAIISSDESADEDSSDESESDDEKAALDTSLVASTESKFGIKSEVRTELYSRRWYLLFLFSVTAMLWNAIWSTWGPIAQSAKLVYGWDDGDIAMFTYLGNIPFLITMFPCAYLMDVKGMRLSMIFCCGVMCLGAGFRCIPGDISTSTWLIRIGQFLNGMAGTIPTSGPALLSGLWFPPNQRATATAVSTVLGYMGASMSFIVGPLLVPEPDELSPVNGTNSYFLMSDDLDTNGTTNSTYSIDRRERINHILYVEFGIAAALFALVLIYFPSKPPVPPSISASIPREKYVNGLKLLIRNKQFWICAIAFSVPIGVYESWQVILDINLDARGISQQTAGWLDFYATVGGCVSGLLVSRFADVFTRQMKLFLLVFYSFATLATLWFTLVILDIIPFDQVSIYAAIILAGVFLDGGAPLFFELTIEVSYPVGEGVTSGFTHMLCAAAGTVFLLIVEIKNIGTEWMNWCFLGCVAATIPLLLFVNTTFGRADIDDMEIDISEDEEAITGIGASDANEKTSLLKNSSV